MLPQAQGSLGRRLGQHRCRLIALLVVLFTGYTPFMSAFCGISLAVIIAGMSRYKQPPMTLIYPAAFMAFVIWKYSNGGFDLTDDRSCLLACSALATLNRTETDRTCRRWLSAFETGVKYSLAVGRGLGCSWHRRGRDQHHRDRLPHRFHGHPGRGQSWR